MIGEKSEVHFYDGMIMFPPGTYELVIKREREKEREECAKVCENLPDLAEEPEYQYDAGYEQGAKDCAAAIRARNV